MSICCSDLLQEGSVLLNLVQARYYIPLDNAWRSHWFILGDNVAPTLQGTSPENSVTCWWSITRDTYICMCQESKQFQNTESMGRWVVFDWFLMQHEWRFESSLSQCITFSMCKVFTFYHEDCQGGSNSPTIVAVEAAAAATAVVAIICNHNSGIIQSILYIL